MTAPLNKKILISNKMWCSLERSIWHLEICAPSLSCTPGCRVNIEFQLTAVSRLSDCPAFTELRYVWRLSLPSVCYKDQTPNKCVEKDVKQLLWEPEAVKLSQGQTVPKSIYAFNFFTFVIGILSTSNTKLSGRNISKCAPFSMHYFKDVPYVCI